MPRGGWNRMSDEERRLSGTYRPSRNDEARTRRIAENIYAGPGFQDVPDPSMPLTNFELQKYFQLAGRLLREGKLTQSTRDIAEQLALLYGDQYSRKVTGKRVPAYISNEIAKHLAMLRLAEDTQPIGSNVGSAPKENPFDICGALVAPFAPGRLSGSPAA